MCLYLFFNVANNNNNVRSYEIIAFHSAVIVSDVLFDFAFDEVPSFDEIQLNSSRSYSKFSYRPSAYHNSPVDFD